MKENKLSTITNLFEGNEIRSIWNSDKEDYYFSVVDVVRALTNSQNPRHYWVVLKSRLKQEGSELVTFCDQLKLKSSDYYRKKGYEDSFIEVRLKGILNRKKLTDVWKDGGITEDYEYAMLTNEIYKTWSGMTAIEYKNYKGIRKEYSKRLTIELGKGYTETNLKYFRQFYLFLKSHTVCDELS